MKKFITVFFLTLFISIKMMGLHAVFHFGDHHHQHCELCDVVLVDSSTPILSVDNEDIVFLSQTEADFHEEIINHYEFSICNSIEENLLFSRPPPTFG